MPTFGALHAAFKQNIVAVLTTAPRPAGRRGVLESTPVATWAREHNLPLFEVERLREQSSVELVLSLGATVGVLADFGQIVPGTVLRAIPNGILNLHPSLLPKYRGATPIPATILGGDLETGVSTILMDEGLDTGPLIAAQRYRMQGDEDAPLLEARLARLAAEGVVETLQGYLAGRLSPRKQSERGVSVTRRLRRSDGEIRSSQSAEWAYRAWRAYRPWPGSWISVAPTVERLNLEEVGPPIHVTDLPLGGFRLQGGQLLLGLEGGALPLLEVTPAGGRRMTGAALVNGHPEILSPHARIRP